MHSGDLSSDAFHGLENSINGVVMPAAVLACLDAVATLTHYYSDISDFLSSCIPVCYMLVAWASIMD